MRFIPATTIAIAFALSGCASANLDTSSTVSDQWTNPNAMVRYTEDRAICADRNPHRNAYFGDLHIHTGYSYDARPYGTDLTPADAYRFAKGEPLGAPPYDEMGKPTQTIQLNKPLDFAAVTDHSEFFGEMQLCTDPTSEVYDTRTCWLVREGGPQGGTPFFPTIISQAPERPAELCGEDGTQCDPASKPLWQLTQDMANEADDKTSRCVFTAFIGYEHTGTPNSNNYHRNVIFRNDRVPERAISYVETPRDHQLWKELNDQCVEGIDGCEVVVIPHNSNISSGEMFPSYTVAFETADEQRSMAEMRNLMEPIMEVFQHKGNSECLNGFPGILGEPDELCNIEQVRAVGDYVGNGGEPYTVRFCEDNEVGRRGFVRTGCISKNDFFRSVLLTGLQDEEKIGVNSYKMGVIASTDTHIGLAGYTQEQGWQGALVVETDPRLRLLDVNNMPRALDANPGGLAGVWAVENSRDALFESMQRREVFGTSGTRIKPRLFAGWNLDVNACAGDDTAAYGYEAGTPMGGDLTSQPTDATLRVLATAVQDPDAAQLQKLQVIKGWVDGEGQSRYQVFDIAGQENQSGSVDLETGKWSGSGAAALCSVFEDPDFDPTEAAYYYMRAVEVPTLRWSWAQCAAISADARPAECDNAAPKVIQELAWTSPIWYLPSP
jgi:hypothetical protein